METRILILVAIISTVLISGCLGEGPDCKKTSDCPKEMVCMNTTCAYPPTCREADELCANSSDCCSGLSCSNYKCG